MPPGSIRLATKRRREIPVGEQTVTRLVDKGQEEHDPCAAMTRRDERDRLSCAITALPERQRQVLIELLKEENRSYLELSRRLGLPVGSIGPTRQRAIARLRQDPRLADLSPRCLAGATQDGSSAGPSSSSAPRRVLPHRPSTQPLDRNGDGT